MKKITLSLMCALGFACITYAQNPISNLTSSYRYPDLNQGQIASMDAFQLQTEKIELTVTVSIGSTSGISKILVLVGSTEGSSDILYKEFLYGSEGVFSDGTSYVAVGNNTTLKLGTFSGIEHYFVETAAIMEDGTQSAGVRVAIQ